MSSWKEAEVIRAAFNLLHHQLVGHELNPKSPKLPT